MRAARYAVEEAAASIRRAGRSAALSVGTIAIAFLTLGGFLLVSTNLQRVVSRWAEAAELSVYLRDGATEAERAALDARLREHPAVAAVEAITKAQALERFRADFPELADVATTLEGNPFPASFEVRIKPDPGSSGAADALAEDLADDPGVADVRYDRRWLARLLAIVAGARVAGLIVAGVLVLGAAFTVAAVVRLSLHARRDEIEIMALVGAPYTFIRGPFVVEGLVLGGAGAAVALLGLWAGFVGVRAMAGAQLAAAMGTGDVLFIGLEQGALLVLAGVVVGALAGTAASRAARA
ncbi:MAG: cell division protein FtsX [Vicinamibacterales bacterium]